MKRSFAELEELFTNAAGKFYFAARVSAPAKMLARARNLIWRKACCSP